MHETQTKTDEVVPVNRPAITDSHRRTLDAIFRHPLSQHLEWHAALDLAEPPGHVEEQADSASAFPVGGEHHPLRKPHTKDPTAPEVIELRRFLERAGHSPRSAAVSNEAGASSGENA